MQPNIGAEDEKPQWMLTSQNRPIGFHWKGILISPSVRPWSNPANCKSWSYPWVSIPLQTLWKLLVNMKAKEEHGLLALDYKAICL